MMTLIAALAVAAAPVAAQAPTVAATPAAVTAAAATMSATPSERRYCVKEQITGSRIAHKTCLTEAGWKEQGVNILEHLR